jgi:hypothetical protein
MPGVAVEYCQAQVPDLRDQLETESTQLEVKLRAELQTFFERVRGDDTGPVAPLDAGKVAAIKQAMLSELRKVDARAYCTGLVDKLRKADPHAIAAAAEEKFRGYVAKAKDEAHQSASAASK